MPHTVYKQTGEAWLLTVCLVLWRYTKPWSTCAVIADSTGSGTLPTYSSGHSDGSAVQMATPSEYHADTEPVRCTVTLLPPGSSLTSATRSAKEPPSMYSRTMEICRAFRKCHAFASEVACKARAAYASGMQAP